MRFWKRALVVLVVLCAVGLPAGYFGGRAMLGRRFHGWRVEGVKASEAGDHARAADFLGRYLRRRPHDTEALRLFIKSRERAELPGGQHLAETVAALQSLLGQEPDRSEERRVGKECRSRWSPFH